MNNKLSYIDIFAGCGGLSLGLHNAGWKGLFAIEKSPDAFKTLEYNLVKRINHFNWPNWLPRKNHDINEILTIYEAELLKLQSCVDLVVGGPPCQGFSMAGRRNENDIRNGLVKSYIKFIDIVRPKIIFFENVKGFTLGFNKNKGDGENYSSYVLRKLDSIGYNVKGELLNMGEYGVPQKRTRFILVGIRKDLLIDSKEVVFSFFEQLAQNVDSFLANKKLDKNTTIGDAISDLLKSNGEYTCSDNALFKMGKYSNIKSAYQAYMRLNFENVHPDSHRFPRHKDTTVDKFRIILNSCRKNKDIDLHIRRQFNIKKHTIIPLSEKEKSPTITTLPDDYIHYSEPRILTVREYARIQSFPDFYIFQGKYTTGGKKRVKEVPRYTQIGNAIPPLFGEQVGLILKKILYGKREIYF